MPSKIEDDILYVDNPNKNIFIFDRDVQVLKKLGNALLEEYPSFQVLAFDNWEDLKDDLLKERPTLFIFELEENEADDFFDFVRFLKKEELLKNVPIIVTGTREVLTQYHGNISKFDLYEVPKAIRMPTFKAVVQNCLTEASSLKVQVINLRAGENLFLQGDKAKMIYITKVGQLEVYRTEDGEEFILGVIGESEILGEMSFLDKTPRSASVRALGACEVLALNIENLHSYLEAQPFWLTLMLKGLVSRLKEANSKMSAS
jgi:hypothetical protein